MDVELIACCVVYLIGFPHDIITGTMERGDGKDDAFAIEAGPKVGLLRTYPRDSAWFIPASQSLMHSSGN